MIIRKDINIFECEAQALVHAANCQNTMGSGIARFIREKYPEAYEVDCQTHANDINKLGYFSWVKAHDGKYIYNCYSQFRYGRDKRYTNYEAIYTGLDRIKQHATEQGLTSLSLPHGMGCVQAGGNFHIVNAMIEVIFENSTIDLHICRYTP